MSLPYAPLSSCCALWAAMVCTAAGAQVGEDSGSRPTLGALGAVVKVGPEYPGARDSAAKLLPNFVLRWGRMTLSNGGPLASRAGEPTEAGLTADLLSLDRLRIGASLSVDQGRDSDSVAGLRGLHDIPPHLRGRLRAGWQLHPHWEVSATWRTDLSGRSTGNALDLTLLHEWRPEFLDHTKWRVSMGASAEWLDATRANLVHGVTAQDAQRSAYAAYRLDAGWSELRLFTNWRRELGSGWLTYGSLTASTLTGQAAQGPLTQRREGLALSVGVGRRF